MPQFTVTAQYRNGGATYQLSSSDRIWLTSGAALTDLITLGQYQDFTHISDANDAHVASCSNANGHVNNTKFLSSTTVSINGGASESLGAGAPTNAEAPLKLTFTPDGGISVTTGGAKFYAYDGTTDVNPWELGTGGQFKAGEAQVSTAWVNANGLNNALSLLDHATATSHNFFVFFSASPGTVGTKTGKVKLSLTYI